MSFKMNIIGKWLKQVFRRVQSYIMTEEKEVQLRYNNFQELPFANNIESFMSSYPEETPQAVISNILHEYCQNIPSGDYLRVQNSLMEINNRLDPRNYNREYYEYEW